MIITALFTSGSTPTTGLSPTIRIRRLDTDALVVTDDAMSEVGDGIYKYSFTEYSGTLDYAIRADGTVSLPAGERYQFSGNDNFVDDIWNEPLSFHTASIYPSGSTGSAHVTMGEALGFIRDIEGGRWKVDTATNEMVFFKEDNVTVVARFNLFNQFGAAATDNVFERVFSGST